MADTLNNTVSAVGNYNSIPTSITSAASVVTMVSGLTIVKEADKEVWVNGNLTYTITVTNNTDTDYTDITITDVLDETLIKFVQDSVTIDDVTSNNYQYDDANHTLTITLGDVASTNSKKASFEVEKV